MTPRSGLVAVALLAGLSLTSIPALAQQAATPTAEESAIKALLVKSMEGDQDAFRVLCRQYGQVKDVALRAGADSTTKVAFDVFDDQVSARTLDVMNQVLGAHPGEVTAVDVIGSLGTRTSATSRYVAGVSDRDFVFNGPGAEAVTEALDAALRRDLGVDAASLGTNLLTATDTGSRSALVEALANREKYATPARVRALEFDHYMNGTRLVPDEAGGVRRMTVKDYYAINQLPPPPRPDALDAFGIHAAEQKMLFNAKAAGLDPIEQAVHDAKYYKRIAESAQQYGGVALTAEEQALLAEAQRIATTKSAQTGLQGRLGGEAGALDVEMAAQKFLADCEAMNERLTQALHAQHLQLIEEGLTKGGLDAERAAAARAELAYAYATLPAAEATGLAGASEMAATALKEARGLRLEADALNAAAAAAGTDVAGAGGTLGDLAKSLPADTRGQFLAYVRELQQSASGRQLVVSLGRNAQQILAFVREHPGAGAAAGGAVALSVYSIVSEAHEKGVLAGMNAAGDLALMMASPAYGALRLIQDVGALGVNLFVIWPLQGFTGDLAYESAGGFLGAKGLSRESLARYYASEEDAVADAEKWFATEGPAVHNLYQSKYGPDGKPIPNDAEIKRLVVEQVRTDYRLGRFAQDLTMDPRTGAAGEYSFFSNTTVGGESVTFQNFATLVKTRDAAARQIALFLNDRNLPWPEGIDRNLLRQRMEQYLLRLWEASDQYTRQLEAARILAETAFARQQAVSVVRDLTGQILAAKKLADETAVHLRELSDKTRQLAMLADSQRQRLAESDRRLDQLCGEAGAARAALDGTPSAAEVLLALGAVKSGAASICETADTIVSANRTSPMSPSALEARATEADERVRVLEGRLGAAGRRLAELKTATDRLPAIVSDASTARAQSVEHRRELRDLASLLKQSGDSLTLLAFRLDQQRDVLASDLAAFADAQEEATNRVEEEYTLLDPMDPGFRAVVLDRAAVSAAKGQVDALRAQGTRALDEPVTTAKKDGDARRELAVRLTGLANRMPPDCDLLMALGTERTDLQATLTGGASALEDAARSVASGRECAARVRALLTPTTPQPTPPVAEGPKGKTPTTPTTSPIDKRVAECARSEQEDYDRAVDWLKTKARDPKAPSAFGCAWESSAPYSAGPECCKEFEALKVKPGMLDEAFYRMQECGWRNKIVERKAALDKALEACRKKYEKKVP